MPQRNYANRIPERAAKLQYENREQLNRAAIQARKNNQAFVIRWNELAMWIWTREEN